MGTVQYMAPEQARGEETDSRADVFALGVLLYEMLAGTPPFSGPSTADIISALLLQEPAPLAHVPTELDRIVRTALRKKKSERYQSCAPAAGRAARAARILDRYARRPPHLVAVNRRTRDSPPVWACTTPASPGWHDTPTRVRRRPRRRRARRVIDSLAVLPLVNQSPDRDIDYLCDGLTESLINSLSQLPRLRVMARSTVFRYKSLDARRPAPSAASCRSEPCSRAASHSAAMPSPSAPSWWTSTTGRSCGERC